MNREYITQVLNGSCSASTFILLCYFFGSVLAFLCGVEMTEQAPAPAAVNEKIASLYDFSRFNKIVVLGGGHGELITSILKANPQAFGVLFDAEQALSGARPKLEAAGIADRCATIAGNSFQSVPAGGDAYIMKWISHDWDDEKATRILKNIRGQIPQNGRVIIVDCGKE